MKTSKDSPIPRWMLDPTEDDKKFPRTRIGMELTVFLAEDDVILFTNKSRVQVEGAEYHGMDAIIERFGHDAVQMALAESGLQLGRDDTAEYFETALRKIYNDPTLELQQIQVGVEENDTRVRKIFGLILGEMSTD